MSRHHARLALIVPLFVFLAGCGGNPPTAEVTGTVTYDGKPLANGTIILETKGSRPATGKIVEGKIVEVMTYKAGDGAPLGEHKVAIQSVEAAASAVVANPGQGGALPKDYMGGKSLIPAVYGDPEKSGLKATITKGENNLKFDLKKNP